MSAQKHGRQRVTVFANTFLVWRLCSPILYGFESLASLKVEISCLFCTRAIVITCGSNVELTRELLANSMRAAQSIVCLGNVSELPFYSSRADRKHCDEAINDCERESELEKTVDGVERNVAAKFEGSQSCSGRRKRSRERRTEVAN